MKMPSNTERRSIPGLEGKLEIDRACNIYLHGSPDHLKFNWPEARVSIGEHTIGVNAAEATALAFLTYAERLALIEDVALLSAKGPKDRLVLKKADSLCVSKWAIWECIRSDKEGFSLPGRIDSLKSTQAESCAAPLQDNADELMTWIAEGTVEASPFEDYPKPTLYENHRSPSRRGNTSAVHVHRIKVHGHWYSFFARGAKKWAYVGDHVSFTYRVTKGGHRNVVRGTFQTLDKNGQPIEQRGDRSWKSQLRSAEQRLPTSRRERVD
ncbi:hypothetical protein [Melittangium boletus]|uniref:hypothetical protein n=1 Tax=Melittangium boletus TaxID=83453 RepID=UPI003DA1E32F